LLLLLSSFISQHELSALCLCFDTGFPSNIQILIAMNSSSKTKSKISKEAFEEVVQALSCDMPLMMHGSGDPADVNDESVRILSELTANFIGNLVEAAVDAHAILTDGPKQLPPPPFQRLQKKPMSPPSANKLGKKRRRITDEFWDEPLIEPKIKKIKDNKPKQQEATEDTSKEVSLKKSISIDDWVGVSGVDFWESSRARKAYVEAPNAIGASSFIFPICHDPGLYGRVLEVQRIARRSIAPTLVDPVVKAVVQEEGASHGPGALRKRDPKATKEGEDTEPEDSDSEEEDGHGATWPGLESLLPVHMTKDLN
jgi:hypothetical protein